MPPWEELYKKSPAESLPWYNTELDGDLKSAPDKLPLNKGTVLDPGTGPGTQAMHLARSGFEVTVTAISAEPIHLAREKSEEIGGLVVNGQKGDLLNDPHRLLLHFWVIRLIQTGRLPMGSGWSSFFIRRVV